MQDLTGKATGSTLTAVEWNQLPQEVQNVITTLGITLSDSDLNQLGKAIAGYVANGSFYTDSGAADAYVLTAVGSKEAPPAYTDGMTVSFIAGDVNTDPSTVNVAGLGVKDIKTAAGDDLSAGVINDRVTLRYSQSDDYFVLTSGVGDVVDLLETDSDPTAGVFINHTLTFPSGGVYVVYVNSTANMTSLSPATRFGIQLFIEPTLSTATPLNADVYSEAFGENHLNLTASFNLSTNLPTLFFSAESGDTFTIQHRLNADAQPAGSSINVFMTAVRVL